MTNYWGSREDLYSVSVKITDQAGTTYTNVFDKMTGGDVASTETKFRPANGTADQVTLGGQRTVNNITVTRLYDDSVSVVEHWLLGICGKAAMVVTKQPLDANGAPQGKPLAYSGKLMAVKPPATDSEASTAAMFELEMSTVTPIG